MPRLKKRQSEGKRESLRLFIPCCISHPGAIKSTELLPEPHILNTVMERALNGIKELLKDIVDIPYSWTLCIKGILQYFHSTLYLLYVCLPRAKKNVDMFSFAEGKKKKPI